MFQADPLVCRRCGGPLKAVALGIEPRVSMLSFSNFGSVDHPHARKVRRATELAKEKAPGLVIDGEMQLMTALDGPLRREYSPRVDNLPATW